MVVLATQSPSPVPDFVYLIIGFSCVFGLLAFLIWVLFGGLRKKKVVGPYTLSISQEEAFERARDWSRRNRYPIVKEEPPEKLFVNTSGMTEVLYTVVGLALCIVGVIFALLWLILARGRAEIHFRRVADGTQFVGELQGPRAKERFDSLVQELMVTRPHS